MFQGTARGQKGSELSWEMKNPTFLQDVEARRRSHELPR